MKIYQIEISNLCNLTCSYCPHPSQVRPAGLMSLDTFAKSLELTVRCGQNTAYLHNFGEPLLHPELAGFVRLCADRGVASSFYTNGLLLTRENLVGLAEAGLRFLCVSEHTKGERSRVQAIIDGEGIPITISDSFRPISSRLHSWAGQIDRAAPRGAVQLSAGLEPCIFQREDACVILWDGRINICCIDVDGTGIQGTVDDYLDNPDKFSFRPAPLCNGCTLMRGHEEL